VPAPSGGEDVVLPELSLDDLRVPAEKPFPNQAMKPGIQMTRAQPVAVVAELFEHPQAVDGRFGSVMKNMKLDEIDA
jgi:hypothetical protein